MNCENCKNKLQNIETFLSAETDMGYYLNITIYQCPICHRIFIEKTSTRP